MAASLGWTPVGLTLVLSPGVKFKPPGIQLQTAAGVPVSWPVGTAARLVITNNDVTPVFSTTWNATVTTNTMRWDESIANAAAVPDKSHVQLYLTYGTDAEILWQSGGVVRRS